MASPKIDFYLEVLSNCKTMFWLISQEQHSIKTHKFTETNRYFYSFTYGKNILSSSSYQWIDFLWICWQTEKLWIQYQNILCLMGIQTRLLFFLLAWDRKAFAKQKSCGFSTKILSVWWEYKAGFFSLSFLLA